MTTDELFAEFWKRRYMGDSPGARETHAKTAFDEVIAPHLAIPRSLKTDPPTDGEFIVLARPHSVAQIHIQRLSHIDPSYTHWIPFPELPPDPIADEFEEHWETVNQDAVDNKESYKAGWIAARKHSQRPKGDVVETLSEVEQYKRRMLKRMDPLGREPGESGDAS